MLLNELEERAAAKTHQLNCVAITKTLAEEYPAGVEYRVQLANAYHNLGLVLGDLRERKEAIDQYELSLSLNEQLSRDFPNVTLICKPSAMALRFLNQRMQNTKRWILFGAKSEMP